MAKLINILLRKTDPDYPWGFSLGAVPPAIHSIQITWVDKNSLASEHLEPGDRVLEIEGMDTTMLSLSEVDSLLTNPSSKLELLIMKKTKSTQGLKGAAPYKKVAETVETQETVSTKREEIAKTELLSEDVMKESRVIMTEGTLHKQVMETTDFAEEEETNTFWTSSTIAKPSETSTPMQESTSNVFWSAESSKNVKNSGTTTGMEQLYFSSSDKSQLLHSESDARTTQIPTNQPSAPNGSSGNSSWMNQNNGQPQSSKPQTKTDTFWTCPPSDLVKQETKKSVKEENLGCRNTSGSSYISESQIFKSLNSYRDESRKMDPREEKRKFWESCRKDDSVRRFKWGDSIKPSRVSSTTASTECLYNRTDTQSVPIPKTERSKSCEPMESHSPSNPFSKSFNDFQYGSKFSPNVSPTNPFYNDFETLNQNCSAQTNSSESNVQFTEETDQLRHGTLTSFSQDSKSFQVPTVRSFSPNYEFVDEMKGSEQNHLYTTHMEQEPTSTTQEVTPKNGDHNQNSPYRPSKAMAKGEFENKCKFFEQATSALVSSVNAKAKGLVEERLKEPSPSPTPAITVVGKSISHDASNEENPESSKRNAPIISDEFYHPLMKPSDFISQQLKSKTSMEPHGLLPKIEIQDMSTPSNGNFFPESTIQNEISYTRDALTNEEKVTPSKIGTGQKVEPIYENLRSQVETSRQVGQLSTENDRNHTHSVTQSVNSAHQNAMNRSISSNCESQSNELKLCNKNSGVIPSRSSAIQASREERLRESMNKKIEWFFDGMKTNDVLNDQVQSFRNTSSDRDFYEKRSFKESSFEKVTRSSHSPYENVESASSREYQEETGPGKNFASRSRTPAGFYDNTPDDFGKEHRAVSPLDISLKSFQDIRNRLGSLLGGTPAIRCSHAKHQVIQGSEDNVEEAFQKLAVQEGIVDSTSSEDRANTRQSSQIGGNGGGGSPGLNCVDGPPPPPPPMLGNIPNQKLAAEIAPMKKNYEPPAAIQNAMMTKDKKPFTYTPGGLDLAEIRSPRMAKRISRNAHMEDSCTPQQQRIQPTGPPQPLPPSALAAMQPQIAIPVFPPGGGFPSQGPPPPPPPPSVQSNASAASPEANFPPPPPPLPSAAPGVGPSMAGAVPPPPPPPPPSGLPTSPIPMSLQQGESKPPQQNGFAVGQPLAFLQDIQNRPQLRSVGPINQNKAPVDFVAEIPVHAPLKPVNHPPRSSYDPSNNSTQIPVNLKPMGPKPAPMPSSVHPFIPQPMSPEPAPLKMQIEMENTQIPKSPSPPRQMQTTAPTVIQNPIRSVVPPSPGPGSPVPTTSNLNKAPAPWMTTRQTSREAPAPWSSKPSQEDQSQQHIPVHVQVQPSIQPPLQQQPAGHGGSSPVTRVIPIQIEGREPPAPPPAPTPAPAQKFQQPQPYQPPYFANAPPMYMTPQQQQYLQQQQQQFMQQPIYVNQQQQQPSSSPQPYNNQVPPQQSQSKTRIIPIQIEGDSGSNEQQRAQGQSPVGLTQRSNSTDSTDSPRRPLQTQTSWSGNPTQSRSFRVLQKITGSEDEATGPFPAAPSETFLVNRVVPPQAASPVGADNSKCWNPNTPPPLYPNPNYWYYPPQSSEEQQQFWEHYNAMCAYMAQMNAAAYRYSPYPMYPYPYLYPSDTEEYSGYSSSDEMTYYGQMFKKQAEMAQAAQMGQVPIKLAPTDSNTNMQINRELSQSSVDSEETEKGDNAGDTSGTDTEVEDDEAKPNTLQSIKSVPNINVYNDSDTQTEESEESEEESDGKSEEAGDIPHQLSIIYEESENSDMEGSKKFSICREQSQSNDSCATLQSDEGDDNDNSTDSTVTVRLPLQFKFSRSSNDEEVATVIVGNSEVESGRATPVSAPESLIITEIVREDSDPDVTATICLKKFKKSPERQNALEPSEKINCCVTPISPDDSNSTSDSPVDFWKDIPDKESYMAKQNLRASNETPSQTSEDDSKHDESDYHSSSTSIQTVKKGMSGSENLSGSETETAYCVNATKYTNTGSESLHDETEMDEDYNGDKLEAKELTKQGDVNKVEDVEEGEEEEEAEEEEEEEEDDEEEKEVEENEPVKGIRNRQSVSSDSESSDEESDQSEDEQDSKTVPSKHQMDKKDEVSVTTKVSNIRKEPSESHKKKMMKEEEEDDSEDDGESEVSERISSRASSSEEEEEDEDEDVVEQKQPKPVTKKEILRPPLKLEKHRSQEESEEDDSGVTSDLSRHISETDTDPECGGELRKMTRYQRAATHSRLFKLLQEECKVDESPEEEPVALSTRKERLSLPLQNQFSVEQESLSSSSGINSPSSPTTTDKLVKELVKSLLSRKKGRHFRKLPLEKLHAAALRILQEDMDPYDTASTSDDSNNLLSPVASTSSSAPADPPTQGGLANPEAYGGNYYDYCRYYSTWGNPELYGAAYDMPDEYEILPSKAFRILQENTLPERYSSPIPRIAVPVRCPRVSHPPFQSPLPPPESNANSSIPESTSTSQET